jgi:RimJ/RimL family protein N-acetyltransferase
MAGIEHVTLSAGGFQLRPPEPAHVEGAMLMLRDPAVLQWNAGPDDVSEAGVLDWLSRSADWSDGTAAVWSVLEDDAYVGSAFLFRIDRDDQRSAEVAYRTAPAARGRGVATSAVLAMAEYAFSTLALERLDLHHAVENAASCRVAAKSGFALEGTVRGGFRDASGRRWDSHVHGRLSTDHAPLAD